MPSRTDLPTPDPANRPMRWPRPTVSRPLIARTPTSSGFWGGSPPRRVCGGGSRRGPEPRGGGRPPRAMEDAPEQAVADGKVFGAVFGPAARMLEVARPGRRVLHLSGGHDRARRKAVDVARRHQVDPLAREPHHLRLDVREPGLRNQAGAADGE